MSFFIEVAVPSQTTTTMRGNIFERFARRLLEAKNYTVVNQVRFTGLEIDLLASENDTGRKILVECKAYRQNIDSKVIKGLLGELEFTDCDAGLLITSYSLGKDAKGLRELWSRKPPEERCRLEI